MNSLLWFDDAPGSREAIVSALSKKMGLNLRVKSIRGGAENWPRVIVACDEKKVDLILVDQCLANGKADLSGGVFSWGSALVGALRVKYPCVPIIGVSAAGKDVPEDQQGSFTDFLELADLSKSEQRLMSIKEGFSNFRKIKAPMTFSLFRTLMKAPNEVFLLDKIVPCQFFASPITNNNVTVFKWFRDEFLHFQGVLVDESTVAAMIGVEVESFNKYVAPLLKKHLYNGIFAGICEKRYWKDCVFTALADIVKDDGSFQLSHYVDHIPRCKKAKAICPICKKPYTDILAFEEVGTGNLTRYPAHLRCSEEANVVHPTFYDPIFVLAGGV